MDPSDDQKKKKKKRVANELTDIRSFEVAYVDVPMIGRRFLVVKGNTMDPKKLEAASEALNKLVVVVKSGTPTVETLAALQTQVLPILSDLGDAFGLEKQPLVLRDEVVGQLEALDEKFVEFQNSDATIDMASLEHIQSMTEIISGLKTSIAQSQAAAAVLETKPDDKASGPAASAETKPEIKPEEVAASAVDSGSTNAATSAAAATPAAPETPAAESATPEEKPVVKGETAPALTAEAIAAAVSAGIEKGVAAALEQANKGKTVVEPAKTKAAPAVAASQTAPVDPPPATKEASPAEQWTLEGVAEEIRVKRAKEDKAVDPTASWFDG